jgi:S-adenosylmethionine synthetase
MVSATGEPLDQPWRVLVRLSRSDAHVETVHSLVLETLAGFPALTQELVQDGVLLS